MRIKDDTEYTGVGEPAPVDSDLDAYLDAEAERWLDEEGDRLGGYRWMPSSVTKP